MSELLRLLHTQRYGRGGIILLLLMTGWLAVAARPCLVAASVGALSSPEQHTQAGGLQGAEADQMSTVDFEHCPGAVCDVLEISQDQLAKQSGLLDILKPLFVAVVFWILPAMLLLASPRPLFLLLPQSLKPPPPLRFRVLLI
jgi:hypothetical protein